MTSPFKFLDAYGADDSKTFFGREAEIEALYTLVVKSRLVLVYGPSGSGKTSLIQCGLANRFKPTDWFPVFVRRGGDLNASLDQKIRAEAVTEIEADADIVAAARSLYLDYYRPLYFIFDQFEELFILGNAEEEAKFFASVQALLASDLNCKIIISMREEYIALLQNFEQAVPTLFQSRLRVEQMTLGTVEDVILGMTAAAGIRLEHGPDTARRIIAQIGDRRAGVQLAYLQVYLDKLYRESGGSGVFTDALVDRTGALGDVMADFLEEQTQAIADAVRGRHPSLPKGSVHRVLEALTTVEGTKLPIARGELAERLPGLAPMLDDLLAALENSRIIRRSDDIIEVSHDQLARRIAERRSAESKALLRVEKLIRDRLASHDQTKTYLSPEELVLARPVMGQLSLSAAEAAFVKASSDKARRRRLGLIGVTGAIMVTLAGFTLWAVIERDRAFNAISVASKTTNSLAGTIVDRLRGIPGTHEVQRELLDQLRYVNDELSFLDSEATGDSSFWLAILDGDTAQDAQDVAAARTQFEKAIGLARQRLAILPGDETWERNVAAGLGRLASLEFSDGKNEAAVKLYREALAITEAAARRSPDTVEGQHDLELALGNLAGAERAAGRLPEARKLVIRALEIARALERREPGNLDMQRDHAFYLGELGKIERDAGNNTEARKAFRASAARLIALSEAEPTRVNRQVDRMYVHFDLADAERRAGQWAEAAAANALAFEALGYVDPAAQNGYPEMLDQQRSMIGSRDSAVLAN